MTPRLLVALALLLAGCSAPARQPHPSEWEDQGPYLASLRVGADYAGGPSPAAAIRQAFGGRVDGRTATVGQALVKQADGSWAGGDAGLSVLESGALRLGAAEWIEFGTNGPGIWASNSTTLQMWGGNGTDLVYVDADYFGLTNVALDLNGNAIVDADTIDGPASSDLTITAGSSSSVNPGHDLYLRGGLGLDGGEFDPALRGDVILVGTTIQFVGTTYLSEIRPGATTTSAGADLDIHGQSTSNASAAGDIDLRCADSSSGTDGNVNIRDSGGTIAWTFAGDDGDLTGAAGRTITLGTATIFSGSDSPEGAVTATVGSLYLRTNGGNGTTIYCKTSGSSSTGWRAMQDAAP